jgi:hypothetical protein
LIFLKIPGLLQTLFINYNLIIKINMFPPRAIAILTLLLRQMDEFITSRNNILIPELLQARQNPHGIDVCGTWTSKRRREMRVKNLNLSSDQIVSISHKTIKSSGSYTCRYMHIVSSQLKILFDIFFLIIL